MGKVRIILKHRDAKKFLSGGGSKVKMNKSTNGALIMVLISIFPIGCTYSFEEYYKQHPTYEMQLKQQIGIMKYDEALSIWGDPIAIFQGDELFVVTWGSEKAGPVVTAAVPVGKSAVVATEQSRSGWKISATFSKETHILKSINYSKW